MSEHIVQFGVGIDDEVIKRNVEENGFYQICRELKTDIVNKIFRAKYYGVKVVNDEGKVDSDAQLNHLAEEIVKEAIADYKDEIIQKATELLCESYKKTKVWKEKAAESLKEEI